MTLDLTGGGDAGPGPDEPGDPVEPEEEVPEPLFDEILDCCGKPFTIAISMLEEKFEQLSQFNVLKVSSDDIGTETSLPEWCKARNLHHKEILKKVADTSGATTLYHYIMKL